MRFFSAFWDGIDWAGYCRLSGPRSPVLPSLLGNAGQRMQERYHEIEVGQASTGAIVWISIGLSYEAVESPSVRRAVDARRVEGIGRGSN
jgi:hypothetical protein